ncbi:MAG: hypothetical protein K5695_06045 [Oscillospiraceae bacterium]|nr:hypothetical protein [Oscillospiraceae bacterium]
MKKTTILTALLCALILTGCGTKTETSAPAPATEAATEAITEAETAAETETAAEPETEATAEIIVEAETGPKPDTADKEAIAYKFIRDELSSSEGLSDLQPYTAINWDMASPECGELAPPKSTQGIIGAVVEDLSGDGAPELLVICSRGYRIDLDFYKITDETCLMIGSYSIDGGQRADHVPQISMKNGKVIVEDSAMVLPGCSSYGHSVTVLAATDGGYETLCELSGFRSPGSMTLNVHGSVTLDLGVEEMNDDNEHPDVEEAARQCLQDAGLDPVYLKAGWPDDRDLCYGIFADFDGTELLFDTTSNEDSVVQFNDHTGLREKLG